MNVLPPSILIHLHAMVRSYTCNCSIRVAVKINYSSFMWVIIYALEQSMQQLPFDREDVVKGKF